MEFWNNRLDELKEAFQLQSEFELSVVLGLHPATLGHLRAGIRPPSPSTAIKILDKRGYALTRDVFIRVLPKRMQHAIARAERRRALDQGARSIRQQQWFKHSQLQGVSPEVDWLAALDQLKATLIPATDANLAKAIDIQAPALTLARSGNRSLPPAARINLLAALGVELDDEALLLAVSSDIREAVRHTSAGAIVQVSTGGQDPNQGLDMDFPDTMNAY